jgi:hypothetical protein
VPASWKTLYDTPLVGVYLLLVLPVWFLGWLVAHGWADGPGVEPYAARFVRIWTIVFALGSIADPIATGLFGVPLVPFVLLGDFRVFALVLPVMQPGRARASVLAEAAAWTLVVPAIAFGGFRAVTALRGVEPPAVWLWIAYEAAFAILTVFLMARIVPGRVGVERLAVRRYLRAVLGVVLAYYALWLASDVIVLRGHDAGWGLRVLPNLLYYAAFVPIAYARFFAAASSRATQASR